MRKGYRFDEKEAAYFVSFAVVYWIDVFIRESYFSIVVDSLDFCRKKKGMLIYAYVIMPSHLHIVFRSSSGDPGGLMRDFKGFTSKKLLKASSQFSESRVWMSRMFEEAGTKKSNIQFKQFWQQDNHAVQLWSEEMFRQKVNYIHNNPVKAGFVTNPEDWKYSSARNYSKNDQSILEIDLPH